MTSNYNIFNDPNHDALFRVWENERKTRDFAVKLMWENMKYFGILIGSLLTAYVALLGYISTTKIAFIASPITFIFNLIILFPVPVTIAILAWYARKDLIQRRRRFLLVVTQLLKLEDLLGLYTKIGDKLPYLKKEDEQYLFVEYREMLEEYQEHLYQGKSTKEFIDDQIKPKRTKGTKEKKKKKEKTSAFSSMQHVYILMIGIAVFLIILGGIVLFDPSLINAHQSIYSIKRL
jgi:hypothetical protein